MDANTNTQPQPITREFKLAKTTRNKTVFAEVPPPGQAPIVETIYVMSWWIDGAEELEITIKKI